MRVQHNIMAMNAYRNYSSNTSALSKNLEKLSSGYKINRAGDDAAGLAISEKMRAQITGLETAQSNASSGINLVQTAEGSLTEVHDMLNRMVKLADQSANGTYDNGTDRANLQKEVSQLQSEIDRISQSSNFNGIKLLDGSLNGPAAVTTTAGADATTGTQASFSIDFAATTLADTKDLNVGDKTYTASSGDETGSTLASSVAALGTITIDGQAYTASASGTKVTFTQSSAAAYTPDASTIAATVKNDGVAISDSLVGDIVTGTDSTSATGAVTTLDFTGKTGGDVIGDTLSAGGTTYEFVATGGTAKTGNTAIEVTGTATAGDIATAVNTALSGNVSGYTTAVSDTTKVTLTSTTTGVSSTAATVDMTGGLTLQIGDTSDDFNKLTVSIQNMNTTTLGIGDIDISSQSGGSDAVDRIKAAINTVSSVRGTLGATQNRLEHTINNLSVMTENTQDAESTIRDTDVADEMMAYTKNNILVQSAQAMLAQANQVPQGVLQLLQ